MLSRLLDLLLDMNSSPQLSAEKRFDLKTGVPALSDVPSLVSDDDLAIVASLQTPEGQQLAEEIQDMIKEKETANRDPPLSGPKPPKPLATLLNTVPHLSSNNPLVSPEVLASLETPEGHDAPAAYLTPDQLEEYLDDIDSSIGNGPYIYRKKEKHDVTLRNPNSAYNWLRKHRPDCFLQDGEGLEKAQGKPGALRGAGKRASLPAPSKPDALEFVEEDGIGYDATLAGTGATSAKGKRKREDGDDGAYHPKSGRVDETGAKVKKPRVRKKKSDDSEETPPSRARKSGPITIRADETPSSKSRKSTPSAKKPRVSSPSVAEEDATPA